MRVFIDTNVWLSAFLSDGLCRKLINETALAGEIISSSALTTELANKLRGKFRRTEEIVEEYLSKMSRVTLSASLPKSIPAVCRDSDDDVHLATALENGCEYLVTGDKDLLVLGQYHDLSIVTPREFIEQLQRE